MYVLELPRWNQRGIEIITCNKESFKFEFVKVIFNWESLAASLNLARDVEDLTC